MARSISKSSRILSAAALVLVAGASASAQCTPSWNPPPGISYPEGVNGNVLCSINWDPDGSGPMSPCGVQPSTLGR